MSELQCEPELGGEGREQGGGEDTGQGGGGEGQPPGGREGQEEGGREEQEGWMREEQEIWLREEQEGGSDEELVGEEPAAGGSGSGKKLTKRQRLAAEREEISFDIQSCNSWKICLQEW